MGNGSEEKGDSPLMAFFFSKCGPEHVKNKLDPVCSFFLLHVSLKDSSTQKAGRGLHKFKVYYTKHGYRYIYQSL